MEITNTIVVTLSEEDRKKSEEHKNALTASKSLKKASYASRITYFSERVRKESGLDIEALLLYWLSWSILHSSPEDGLNSSCFHW